jgi:hypothetical protein
VLSVSEPFEGKTTDFTICTDFSLILPTLGLLGLLIQKPMYCYSPFQDCPDDKNFFVSSFRFYGETINKSADFFVFGNLVIFFFICSVIIFITKAHHGALGEQRLLFLKFLSANCYLSVLSQLRILLLFGT